MKESEVIRIALAKLPPPTRTGGGPTRVEYLLESIAHTLLVLLEWREGE